MYATIIISAIGASAAGAAAYYAYKTYNIQREAAEPIYDIGFPEGNSVVHENVIEIDENEMGQRVHFRVINKSPYPVRLPWCSVRFPMIFKHPRESGSSEMTANSTLGEVVLWKEQEHIITHLVNDRPDGKAEVKGILVADLLPPNDPKDFWIRFKLPEKADKWKIEVNIDVTGARSVTQDLVLIGRHS
jgi:hypothetical protein